MVSETGAARAWFAPSARDAIKATTRTDDVRMMRSPSDAKHGWKGGGRPAPATSMDYDFFGWACSFSDFVGSGFSVRRPPSILRQRSLLMSRKPCPLHEFVPAHE